MLQAFSDLRSVWDILFIREKQDLFRELVCNDPSLPILPSTTVITLYLFHKLLAINWLLNISYVKKKVAIRLLKDAIRTAPESNSTKHLELDYEKSLYDFYDKNLVR